MSLSEIQVLYENYIGEVNRLEAERKPTDGIFGMGRKISDAPCHEEFINELEALLKDFGEDSPSADDVKKLLEYIYFTPASYEDTVSAYWMMVGAHSLTLELTELLDPQSASELSRKYISAYPKVGQFPVQKKVCKALAAAMKG